MNEEMEQEFHAMAKEMDWITEEIEPMLKKISEKINSRYKKKIILSRKIREATISETIYRLLKELKLYPDDKIKLLEVIKLRLYNKQERRVLPQTEMYEKLYEERKQVKKEINENINRKEKENK